MILRLLMICLAVSASTAQADLLLDPTEITQTLSHGPWPPDPATDPSNRMSGTAAAITLGEYLFHSPDLSRDGTLSCASCHDPAQGFTDGLARGRGRVLLDRNTPSLWNLPVHRWFGWAGATDNLWAQSLLPILHKDEMGHSADSLKRVITEGDLAQDYAALFGPATAQPSQIVAVNTAKALAAYQETLITGPTPFDRFRDALAAGDLATAATYPEPAQRGLQIFIGAGNCAFCHLGPAFTNGEFHDAAVPYFITDTRVDTGRHGGLQALLQSPYTLDGDFTDDPDKTGAWAVRNVRPLHSDFGTFRVPSLRNIALTAPYMHDGSLPDLDAVIRHYNDIDLDRMHADGEAILAPLSLTERQIADLVAFLETLSDR